jgi:hypothetical protein
MDRHSYPKTASSYSMAMMCSMDAMQRAWIRAAALAKGYF